jgi:hypothetical protein
VGTIAGLMLGFGIALLREGLLVIGARRSRRNTLQDAH